tara:strand:+ start:1817 stop:2053 length:237 start_codon:yes stop_codon:yes gene_type:complete
MSNKPKTPLKFGVWAVVTNYGDTGYFPDKQQAFDWYGSNTEMCYGRPFPVRVGNKANLCDMLNMHSFKDICALPCFGD